MPANTEPIFALVPKIGYSNSAVTAANTATDGTGTVQTLFTAGANGSKVTKISFRALGTNVQTVARIYLNNGGATSTASNNVLYREVTLPATSASNTSAQMPIDINCELNIPANWTITWHIATAVSAGYRAFVEGADY